MTDNAIAVLYENGKKVYNGEIELNDAIKAANKECPEVAESSARHYINWYTQMRKGDYLTWNSNSKLLLYYANRIIVEEGPEEGKKAVESVKAFARHHGRKTLENEVQSLLPAGSQSGNNKQRFETWLRNSTEKEYTDNTIHRYSRALENSEEWLQIKLDKSIFEIDHLSEFETAEVAIKGAPNYKEINQNHGHGDLSAALTLYRKFILENENKTEMTTVTMISRIKYYISNKGFKYNESLIENFYLCLKSKPFVILAGTSGTGKTKLVKLFAEAIGAEYSMVSVRPDWSDGSDLFGHHDLNGNFIEGPVCSAFDKALEDPERPVILCIDEMNLARVEYYFSDFLSIIETREKNTDGQIVTDAIAQYRGGIPDNLYIVGTVNMDETTFPFSKKVLDRANTIEFNYVDLVPSFELVDTKEDGLQLSNSFLRTDYLVLARDCADESDFVVEKCDDLQKINQILRKANAHVGYRVRDEIVFYMLNNKKAGNLITEDQALDNEIMQKILPRIQGSAAAIRTMLIELFDFCMGSGHKIDAEAGDVGAKMRETAYSAKYPESADKIGYMMMRYEEDGFTSYWL